MHDLQCIILMCWLLCASSIVILPTKQICKKCYPCKHMQPEDSTGIKLEEIRLWIQLYHKSRRRRCLLESMTKIMHYLTWAFLQSNKNTILLNIMLICKKQRKTEKIKREIEGDRARQSENIQSISYLEENFNRHEVFVIQGNQSEVEHVTFSVFYLVEVFIRRGTLC